MRARIWHTRSDVQKQNKDRTMLEVGLNKLIEFAGDQSNAHEHNPTQLKALNKKVFNKINTITKSLIEHSITVLFNV